MNIPITVKRVFLILILHAVTAFICSSWYGNCLARKAQGIGNPIIEAGRLCGLLGVYLTLLQLLLIGRVSWIERSFGLDRLTIAHHVQGLLIIPLLGAHPLLLSMGYGMESGNSFLGQYRELLAWDSVVPASVGMALLTALVILSTSPLRKRLPYELWYLFHLGTYVALALSFAHQFKTGSDLIDSPLLMKFWYLLYIFSLGNLVLYHLFIPLFLSWRHQFRIVKIQPESADVVSIHIGGRNLEKFRFEAGQFVFARFLSRGCIMESHPFSLSLPPGKEILRLTIKKAGTYTSRVHTLKPGTRIILEGPLGLFTPSVSSRPGILLLAGGIGITPLRALAEEFAGRGREVTLLYNSRRKGGIVFEKELEALKGTLAISYIISDIPAPGDEQGRIDAEKISRLVPDLTDRDIYLCGPPAMMRVLVETLTSLGVKSKAIHYARFSL